ncbi:MAG: deoxyribose-phosphate aldolase [Planctomycetota bacterium]|nr:deoxyribose-phosphate aldolase [Planctomycetota bacterium]
MSRRTIDKVAIEARASAFTTRSLKGAAKLRGLHMVASMIDLTTLEGKDSAEKVRALCAKAMSPDPHISSPQVAAVCVYPSWVALAKKELRGTGIHVASVATAFPSGQLPIKLRLQEVRQAVLDGADEIDMVINRGAFLAGEYSKVSDEISAIKTACGKAHLKVILETGELETYDDVRRASEIAITAGGDFIKTSTGKVAPAATMPVTLVMLECIRDHYLKTGKMVGMKPAGGISSAKLALHYLVMVKETLGDAWLSPDWFRFGASSLLNDVLLQLHKIESGHYTANYDVTAS